MINENLINLPQSLEEDYSIEVESDNGRMAVRCDCGAMSIACQSVVICSCHASCVSQTCTTHATCPNDGVCVPATMCTPANMCASTCIPAYQCGACQTATQACTTTCETTCQTTCESVLQAHSTLVGSTVYEIQSGKTLISGTAHDLSEGKVLVGSTVYSLPLAYDLIVYNGGANVLTGTFTSRYIAGSMGANNVSGTSTISNGLIICGGAMSAGAYPTCGQAVSGGQYGWCYIGPIDFTGFNSLHVTGYKNGAQGYFGYSSASTAPSNPSNGQITQLSTSSTTYTIDISTITGNRYFMMTGFNQQTTTPGYAYISKIWLTP